MHLACHSDYNMETNFPLQMFCHNFVWKGDHEKMLCSQFTVCIHKGLVLSMKLAVSWTSVGGVSFTHIICQHTQAADTHTPTRAPWTHFGIQAQRIIVSLCVKFACSCMGLRALYSCLQAAWVLLWLVCLCVSLLAIETAIATRLMV